MKVFASQKYLKGLVSYFCCFVIFTGGSHSLAGSTTSITSGTPSTDLRFSEYHLDKVKSYFSPMEDDHEEQRPTRAYSIGSRPEKFKNKNAR